VLSFSSLPKIRAELLAKDGIRFATFLGLFPSIYDLVVELLEEYRGRRVSMLMSYTLFTLVENMNLELKYSI